MMLKVKIVTTMIMLGLKMQPKNQADNNMFKVNNRNTRTRRRSSVFIVNFEHISHLVLVFLLWTLSMYIPAGKTLIANQVQVECSTESISLFVANFSFTEWKLLDLHLQSVWKKHLWKNEIFKDVADQWTTGLRKMPLFCKCFHAFLQV